MQFAHTHLQVQHGVALLVVLHGPQRDALVLADALLNVLALRPSDSARRIPWCQYAYTGSRTRTYDER